MIYVNTDALDHILKNEMLNSLYRELGFYEFNKWYIESI